MVDKKQAEITDYIVVCVKEFAARFDLSNKEAFDYLQQYSGIGFLKEHYEIEKTLSIDNAIDDLVLVCKRNGGYLENNK